MSLIRMTIVLLESTEVLLAKDESLYLVPVHASQLYPTLLHPHCNRKTARFRKCVHCIALQDHRWGPAFPSKDMKDVTCDVGRPIRAVVSPWADPSRLELMIGVSQPDEVEPAYSLAFGDLGLRLGLLIRGRSRLGESSALLPFESVSGSSAVMSCVLPASSGCSDVLGSSLCEPTSSGVCMGETGERGLPLLPVVLVKALTMDQAIEPRVVSTLNLLGPFA